MPTRRRDQGGEPVEQFLGREGQRGPAVGLGFRQPIDHPLGVDLGQTFQGSPQNLDISVR
jgi:hypothetical protein